jgi:hypothetical protein
MNAPPDLLRAVVLACVVAAPDHTKRQLLSRDIAKRSRAEDALAARFMVALSQVGG